MRSSAHCGSVRNNRTPSTSCVAAPGGGRTPGRDLRFPADPGPVFGQSLPMTTSELFAAMPATVATDILEFNHANERRLYKAAIDAVAQARRVRPVFIE